MAKLCAIDVGSNGIRLSIANLTPSGLEAVDYQRIPVRLGADVFRTGRILPATARLTAAAFKSFAATIAEHEPVAVRAIATSALREAKNRDAVLRQIDKASGIRIDLIDGDEEARLAYMAIAQRLDLKKANALLIDIGGGSVEISSTRRGAIVASESFKLGTVRMLETFGNGRSDQKKFYRLLHEYAETTIDGVRQMLGRRELDFAVGTGGNIEALGDIGHEQFGESAANKLSAAKLKHIVKRLQSLSYEQRVTKLGLRRDRADVIVPAAVMLLHLLEQFDVKHVLIPRVGVKDGIMLGLAHAFTGTNGGIGDEHVLPSTRQLASRYGVDMPHAERVAGFADGLFAALQRVHRLSARDRLLLQSAAILHDVGKAINTRDHHKHSQYIIGNATIVGLPTEERQLTALIARYHRKSLPKPEHLEFSGLRPNDKRRVRMLGGILRLANAMDIEHGGQLLRAKYRLRGRTLTIRVGGKADLALEIWAMQQRSNLLAEAAHLAIQIERIGRK